MVVGVRSGRENTELYLHGWPWLELAGFNKWPPYGNPESAVGSVPCVGHLGYFFFGQSGFFLKHFTRFFYLNESFFLNSHTWTWNSVCFFGKRFSAFFESCFSQVYSNAVTPPKPMGNFLTTEATREAWRQVPEQPFVLAEEGDLSARRERQWDRTVFFVFVNKLA